MVVEGSLHSPACQSLSTNDSTSGGTLHQAQQAPRVVQWRGEPGILRVGRSGRPRRQERQGLGRLVAGVLRETLAGLSPLDGSLQCLLKLAAVLDASLAGVPGIAPDGLGADGLCQFAGIALLPERRQQEILSSFLVEVALDGVPACRTLGANQVEEAFVPPPVHVARPTDDQMRLGMSTKQDRPCLQSRGCFGHFLLPPSPQLAHRSHAAILQKT
jgi:hypothetical protein